MGKITGFLEYERKDKKEIDPKERIKNFSSFHIPFTEEEQKEQASRCMNCGIPFCQSALKINNKNVGCPLSNLIPEWNHLIYLGLFEEAYKRLSLTALFPESLTKNQANAIIGPKISNTTFVNIETIMYNTLILPYPQFLTTDVTKHISIGTVIHNTIPHINHSLDNSKAVHICSHT